MDMIIPIRDLKDTTKISELCHSKNEPVYITKNGYGDMVIMSLETFENKMSNSKFEYEIREKNTSVQETTFSASTESTLLYSLNEIRKVLSPIFSQHNVKWAKLFGSYARGDATAKSDIDILVDSNLKGLKFFGLVNDINESLRVSADVYDVRELTVGSEIEKNVRREGILIYGEKA